MLKSFFQAFENVYSQRRGFHFHFHRGLSFQFFPSESLLHSLPAQVPRVLLRSRIKGLISFYTTVNRIRNEGEREKQEKKEEEEEVYYYEE